MTILRVDNNESIEHRMYDSRGLSPTLPTGTTGGNLIPKIRTIPHGYNDGWTKELPSIGSDNGASYNELLDLGTRIRRLTPTECERLQSFPDGWTSGVSDTARYKMLGNAVTVNVIEAIGRKILDSERTRDGAEREE